MDDAAALTISIRNAFDQERTIDAAVRRVHRVHPAVSKRAIRTMIAALRRDGTIVRIVRYQVAHRYHKENEF